MTKDDITRAYDVAADAYASELWNELAGKNFDRILLNWFASEIPRGDTILEIGCGPGEVSGYLAARGGTCLGTDRSERMIKNARDYFPSVEFQVRDFFELGFDDAQFSGVVGFYAIVNLRIKEVRAVLFEILRVLEPHGLFLFSFHIL
jgi:ubiquinone/menaquinone biosynthesis C-methylase UbiE